MEEPTEEKKKIVTKKPSSKSVEGFCDGGDDTYLQKCSYFLVVVIVLYKNV